MIESRISLAPARILPSGLQILLYWPKASNVILSEVKNPLQSPAAIFPDFLHCGGVSAYIVSPLASSIFPSLVMP